MSSTSSWAGESAESGPQDQVSRLFPATVGRFDDRADRAVIDGLTRWVEDHYREDLAKRPSKHVYVRTLPGPVIEQIDRHQPVGEPPDHLVAAPADRRQAEAWSVVGP